MLLLLDTGLRAGELAGLKQADVHLSEGYVKVVGKGCQGADRSFGAAVQRALWRYQSMFRGAGVTYT